MSKLTEFFANIFAPRSLGLYRRPFPDTVAGILELGSPGHVGKNRFAVDFLVPEGTSVLAPRDGVVIGLKDDSDQGGPHRRFQSYGNFINISHRNGEWSRLVHLAKGSIRVKLWQEVKAGEAIAQQGSTGWTYEPHIHFAVYRNGESAKIRFNPPLAY